MSGRSISGTSSCSTFTGILLEGQRQCRADASVKVIVPYMDMPNVGSHVRTRAPWALCPKAVADLACGIWEHVQLHVFAATVQLPAFVAVPPIPACGSWRGNVLRTIPIAIV